MNSTRLRSSETAKMFFRLSIVTSLQLRDHVCRAARRRDLLRRLAAELVRAHGQRLADVAARQHLDRAVARR